LDAIVSFLSDRGMVGKISGSGLGDCVMGLWDQKQSPDPTLHHHNGPGIMIPAKPDHQGLVWWKGDTSPNSWGD
jgi:mevalonate kinase